MGPDRQSSGIRRQSSLEAAASKCAHQAYVESSIILAQHQHDFLRGDVADAEALERDAARTDALFIAWLLTFKTHDLLTKIT